MEVGEQLRDRMNISQRNEDDDALQLAWRCVLGEVIIFRARAYLPDSEWASIVDLCHNLTSVKPTITVQAIYTVKVRAEAPVIAARAPIT